jgi:hypothetical protein
MAKVTLQFDVDEGYADAVKVYVAEAVGNLVREQQISVLLAEHGAEIQAAVDDALTVSILPLGEEAPG